MLRISRAADQTDAIVLRLEGQVVGPWVGELKQAYEDSRRDLNGSRPLILDLQGVSFLDAAAVALLRQLVTGGASLTNYSVFLAEQLKEVTDVDC